MKLQIDFTNKEIVIASSVNLKEFVDKISKFLPDWETYSLKVTTKIEWYPYNCNPYKPYITWGSDTVPQIVCSGTDSKLNITTSSDTSQINGTVTNTDLGIQFMEL